VWGGGARGGGSVYVTSMMHWGQGACAGAKGAEGGEGEEGRQARRQPPDPAVQAAVGGGARAAEGCVRAGLTGEAHGVPFRLPQQCRHLLRRHSGRYPAGGPPVAEPGVGTPADPAQHPSKTATRSPPMNTSTPYTYTSRSLAWTAGGSARPPQAS
jgi:hypothetical protein